MREIWSRRAGLNRQPADHEKSFKDNNFNAFNPLFMQQEEECGTSVTPIASFGTRFMGLHGAGKVTLRSGLFRPMMPNMLCKWTGWGKKWGVGAD
jgi:hypothetical protein